MFDASIVEEESGKLLGVNTPWSDSPKYCLVQLVVKMVSLGWAVFWWETALLFA
jgi:hypothetical protein